MAFVIAKSIGRPTGSLREKMPAIVTDIPYRLHAAARVYRCYGKWSTIDGMRCMCARKTCVCGSRVHPRNSGLVHTTSVERALVSLVGRVLYPAEDARCRNSLFLYHLGHKKSQRFLLEPFCCRFSLNNYYLFDPELRAFFRFHR